MSLTRIFALVIFGGLLTLSACGSSVAVGTTVTPTIASSTPASATPIPPIPPTPAPPQCAAYFSATYVTSIPRTNFKATNVYALIPLPSQTRVVGDDATGGTRGSDFCSGGTVASIQAFMTSHLTQLGWQLKQPGDQNPPRCIVVGDQSSQCWQNGTYALYLKITSPTDWIIIFHDPDYPY